MISAKSNGIVKDLPLDGDLEFTNYIFDLDGTETFTIQSPSFFSYNRFMGIFAGWVLMKPNATMQTNEKLIKLPVIPKIAESIILGFYGDNAGVYYVDKDGYLVSNSNKTFPSVSTYVYFIGSFGINGGGFLTFFKKLRAFFQGKEVAYA